ncbi:hypothetical protein AQUCO_00100544v1 [Aquilegia coerulea]|uniref:Protein kinase domain-containing protein n=1 Tax=Aquilegia coerulea TaxID=218851 RepID=A0A2G5FAV2_AQUCA|nr:hypothetical protein AQUCO_00100544v1 [Aquilegia coerulea]
MRLELLLFLVSWLMVESAGAINGTETLPGCQQKCGNVEVPYPFGIGAKCSIATWANINCNTTFNPPKPFIGGLEVVQFSLDQVRIRNHVAVSCYNQFGNQTDQIFAWINLIGTPYTFSFTKNVVTVLGCDTTVLTRGSQDFNYTSGCISICDKREYVIDGTCSGLGCCETSIPKGMQEFYALVSSLFSHAKVWSFDPCGYAFLGEKDMYSFKASDFGYSNSSRLRDIPVVLNFAVGNQTCKHAKQNPATFACKDNSYCYDSVDGNGYLCSCRKGYEGNPYLKKSCQGLGFGFLFLLVGGSWLYFSIKKRKLIQLKEKFFQKNGGLLLKQQISSHEGGVELTKIFTAEELKLATNNYDQGRILGQGGYGTVYKGVLPDLRIVAIKKSKVVDKSQLSQFINEVVILTQINHRNVVKLLGCCLESELPLLVYEFVSNGTLSQLLQKKSGTMSSLSWEDRLRIGAEIAGAVSYLHSAASIPIIHRDVKSANILLDDNYIAKVADFGASRLNPLDESQISTLVQGTMGYLDPEYFHTGQLTEKSDVYSFGVVLAELLTGEKPLCFVRPIEQRNLATYFLLSMKEDSLFELLEAGIINEGKEEQVLAVAELAKRCLNLKGEERPSMKEVAAELEGLRGFVRHTWVQKINGESRIMGPENVDLYAIPSDAYDINGASGQYSLEKEMIRSMNVSR